MLPKFRSCIFLVSRNTIVFYTSVDSCKKTAVVFDHAVSMLEFINCQSVQGQVRPSWMISSVFYWNVLLPPYFQRLFVFHVNYVFCNFIQVTGKVPTISIDKTDGCQIYLSKESMDCEIVTAKSSEMNIVVPDNGDYVRKEVISLWDVFYIDVMNATHTLKEIVYIHSLEFQNTIPVSTKSSWNCYWPNILSSLWIELS